MKETRVYDTQIDYYFTENLCVPLYIVDKKQLLIKWGGVWFRLTDPGQLEEALQDRDYWEEIKEIALFKNYEKFPEIRW